jgi:hypothetical protein
VHGIHSHKGTVCHQIAWNALHELTAVWRKLCIEKLHGFYVPHGISRMIKSKMQCLACLRKVMAHIILIKNLMEKAILETEA